MENNEFIERYLSRIEFNDEVDVNIETLSKLQDHHLRYVPFENLDIFEGRKINLEIPGLFEKIVINHRGGICYELNGLFVNY